MKHNQWGQCTYCALRHVLKTRIFKRPFMPSISPRSSKPTWHILNLHRILASEFSRKQSHGSEFFLGRRFLWGGLPLLLVTWHKARDKWLKQCFNSPFLTMLWLSRKPSQSSPSLYMLSMKTEMHYTYGTAPRFLLSRWPRLLIPAPGIIES